MTGQRNILYLDYQATTPLLPEVFDAMQGFFQDEFANPSSREHLLGEFAHDRFLECRELTAQLLGISSSQVTYTSGATESANLAIFGLLNNVARPTRNTVLVSPFEHACVIEPLKVLEAKGVITLKWIPHVNGLHVKEDIMTMVDANTIAVFLMSVNNEIGTIHNDTNLYSTLRENDILLFRDFSQAPGKTPISFSLEADVGFFSAHKMYGPKGVGLLVLRKECIDSFTPLYFGGGQQDGRRPGTIPMPLVVGFTKALQCSIENCTQWCAEVSSYREFAIQLLEEAKIEYAINGPSLDQRVAHNLNIWFKGVPSEILLARLPDIAISTGSACTNLGDSYSKVLTALGLSESVAAESVRLGLSHLIKGSEFKHTMKKLTNLVNTLQSK